MIRSSKRFVMFLVLGCLIAFAAATAARAQVTTGRISGTVTDPNGAVVSGANVTATNADTNLVRETTTDGEGNYAFQLLPPGNYRVEATASGFQTTAAQAVVNITQTTTVDVQLAVAGANVNTVVVTPEAPVLQAETSQVGRVIEGETIRQLPLPTRNFQQLLTLSAGAQASVSNNTDLGRGDINVTVNGQRTTSNSVRINGVDANSIGTNSTPNLAVPATDSLQEFIVQTSLYDASNGRNAGGNVEAVTRSGANDFRGNVYYFLRNKALNANDFFLNAAGRPKPVLSRNQYGGTLGGPIVRNRAFFFVSYQGTRERNGASLTNSLTFPVIPVQLTDTNRTAAGLSAAFGVPVANISPVSVAILNARLPSGQFAIPSAATATGLTPQSGISRFRENQFNFNGDLNITDNHSFSGKFFIADNPTFQANYNFAGLGNGPTQLIGTGGDLTIKQKLLSLTDTYVFSSNVSNQARFGFSRLRVTSVPEEPFTASQFGITNPIGAQFPGAPTFTVTGLFTLGSSPFADQSSRINAYTFQDTLSIVAGNHRVRTGGEFRFSQVKFYFNAFSRGQLIYPTFANFLQGQAVSIIGSGVYDRSLRVKDFSAFVQDDYKVNDRLTLNLGLRYDFYGLPVDTQGRLVNFLPEQFRNGASPNGFVQAEGGPLAGVPTVEKTLVPTDKNNFAPRVGFAYRIDDDGRLVLRGGYGIYYDRLSTRFANTQLLNYPYLSLAVGVFRPAATPFAPVPLPSQYPVAPTIPASGQLAGVPISGIFISPDLITPYVQQYNFGVQYEFLKNTVLEVNYVGNRGTNLLQVVTLNQPVFNSATNSFAAPFGTALSTQKNTAGGIQQAQTTSNSHYNSLQVTGTRRFSQGLQLLAAYTLSKSIDYYSGAAINELAAVPGDQFDWRTNRGRSDFNRKHRFVLSGVYDLPKLNFESSAARAIFNNWQIAGIAVFQSGLPFSVIDNPNNNIINRANFNPAFNGEISTSGSTTERLNAYFNAAAFVTSRPILSGAAIGAVNNPTFDRNAPFGNTPRNFLTGPGQKNVDFSIIKFIPITERLRGEFRTEFFNLFNWANFANPNANIAVPATFGRITSTSAGPRVIQFGFKLNF
jgi:outer membrane receptor protein involved in Fe transport